MYNKNFPAVNFSKFSVIKTLDPGIGIQHKMLDPEPESINPVRNTYHNQ